MKSLKILYLEDSAEDAELTGRTLKKAGIPYSFRLVDQKNDYQKALEEFGPDLVLSDHSLFQFNSLEALKIFKSFNFKIPFILVTGTVSEEFAVNILKEGADDYLLKNNLARLPNAIINALEKCRMESDLQQHLDDIIANEALLKQAEHLAKIGSWQVDMATKKMSWSEEAYRIYGYEPGEIDPDIQRFLKHLHPEDLEEVRLNLNRAINALDSYESELRIIDKNGDLKFLSFKVCITRDDQNHPLRLIGFSHDITKRKVAEQELINSFNEVAKLEREIAQQQLAQQKLITEVTIQAQEKERDDLAKELHDNINQVLATVKMFLNMAKDNDKMRKELVQKSYHNINYAIEEIRQLSKSLVAPSLGDIGLFEALEDLASEINAVNGLSIEIHYHMPKNRFMDQKMELILYRIAQEQLNNIVKHANATQAKIVLKLENQEIHMAISDNGVGFDPNQKRKGIGLRNMHSRVEFYSGKLTIVSAPQKGCTINIYVPL